MPWMKRAPTSISWLFEKPHKSEATVKIARPVRKTRRRPSRSPRRPESNNRPPKVIR